MRNPRRTCRRLLAVLVSTMLAGVPHALADDTPAEVAKVIGDARKSCEDNGGKFTMTPAAVRKVELTGDGRDDYIVNLGEATCDGGGDAFCGTGGCEVSVLVALPSGKFVTVFNNQVLDYAIVPATHAMKFQLHGSYCGEH